MHEEEAVHEGKGHHLFCSRDRWRTLQESVKRSVEPQSHECSVPWKILVGRSKSSRSLLARQSGSGKGGVILSQSEAHKQVKVEQIPMKRKLGWDECALGC